MTVKNLFGDLATNMSIKALIAKLFHLTFDTAGQLRTAVSGSVSISSGTVTTVTTVTTANISYGDTGKIATSIIESRNLSYNTRRNYDK